jgi:streptomycin 6-kinase
MARLDPASLQLPDAFLQFNNGHEDWLRGLPELIAEFAERWSLTLGPPVPAIRINYVAPARRADGTACIFKIGWYVEESVNEIAALQFWDGDGAARLLDADPRAGALLIERLEPGTMLLDLAREDDDAATLIAAGLLRQLWRPLPPESGLRPLASWLDAYDRNRATLERGAGGFPSDLFRRADALRRELLASTDVSSALHGDLHHYNILQAQRAPWLAIDPKGLAGDRCFDVCQFLRNPLPAPPPSVNRRRLDIFCAELGLDRARTRDWCFVHAILDACWSFEDGDSWASAVEYARETLTF